MLDWSGSLLLFHCPKGNFYISPGFRQVSLRLDRLLCHQSPPCWASAAGYAAFHAFLAVFVDNMRARVVWENKVREQEKTASSVMV